MQCIIRTCALGSILFLISHQSKAGGDSTRPIHQLGAKFLVSVFKWVSLDRPTKETGRTGSKICSCQVLELRSNNYRHKNVAVFAEKTNYGNYSTDFGIACAAIEKEKKHLKQLFYDRLTVVKKMAEATDCKSLFAKLKVADQSIVLYDILDADLHVSR